MGDGTPASRDAGRFPAGSRLAGYLLEERIGRGGMAEVFRALDERGFSRVGLLGTWWLVESTVYPDKLAARGLEYQRPAAEEARKSAA